MNKEHLSLKYNYSPKKLKNICKYLLIGKPTIKELRQKALKIFNEEQIVCVPNYIHKKGESHKKKSLRTTKLPGGFFPNPRKNIVWLRMIDNYLKRYPLNSIRQVNRYYFHTNTHISGTKYLRVSRKSIPALKRKHTVTVYLELL